MVTEKNQKRSHAYRKVSIILSSIDIYNELMDIHVTI